MRYGAVLFDLDGTLTDPGVGIANSVSFALAALGLEPLHGDQLRAFVGPPLQDSFESLGLDGPTCQRAVAEYRRYFAETGLYENAVYPGIEMVISALCEAGVTLAVATSKPTVFARQVLDHFGLSDSFACVSGADLDGNNRRKDQVIRRALLALGPLRCGHVCMVGDRALDVIGATVVGLPAVGVAWGYAAEGELESAGATMIARTPAELFDFLT